jgi:PAS domain S-box-containing protein
METLAFIQIILEIIIALIALGSTIWGGWKLIIKPIKTLLELQKAQTLKLEWIDTKMNNLVLPIINSLEKEFSKNGGKSIKDQINRIDDAVSLAELRSKMIASNLLSTGAFECDAAGNYTWANKAACDMFGLSFEEFIGKGWLTSVIDDERANVWKTWIEAINLDIPYEVEYTIVNRQTHVSFRVRVVAIPHKTVDKKILAYYGTIVKVV